MEPNELKERLRDHEDGWVERKTKNIKDEEILEALVGLANSVPVGQHGLLVIGVSDDGKFVGVDNTDKPQKKIHRLSEWCFPTVEYQARVLEEFGLHVVVVMIPANKERPHFAGPAYVRIGSQFQKSSQKKFNELIDRRNNLVDWILTEPVFASIPI